MRVAIYDRVEPPVPAQLPLRLTQTCSQRAAIALLVLVVPAAFGGTFAALAVVFQALLAPDARAVVEQHPALGLEILAAIGFIIYLLALPTRRLLARLSTTRTVEIADGLVSVTEGGHFRSWAWVAPLASFTGVAHHVRASLSGTRHELILVHPTRDDECALECGAADITKRGGPRCDTSRPQRDSAQRTLSLQGPMAANDTSVFAGCRPCLTPPPSKNSTLSLATL